MVVPEGTRSLSCPARNVETTISVSPFPRFPFPLPELKWVSDTTDLLSEETMLTPEATLNNRINAKSGNR